MLLLCKSLSIETKVSLNECPACLRNKVGALIKVVVEKPQCFRCREWTSHFSGHLGHLLCYGICHLAVLVIPVLLCCKACRNLENCILQSEDVSVETFRKSLTALLWKGSEYVRSHLCSLCRSKAETICHHFISWSSSHAE